MCIELPLNCIVYCVTSKPLHVSFPFVVCAFLFSLLISCHVMFVILAVFVSKYIRIGFFSAALARSLIHTTYAILLAGWLDERTVQFHSFHLLFSHRFPFDSILFP